MLDFITLFTLIFYGSLLLPLGFLFLSDSKNYLSLEAPFFKYFSWLFCLFVFIIIAFRPIGETGFNDTAMYMEWFDKAHDSNIYPTKDLGFGLLMFLASKIISVRLFFVLCAGISLGLLIYIAQLIAGKYWFMYVLASLVSLYFWNYQVFTIRQGIASMLFIAGFLQKKWGTTAILFLLAISFHKSLALPVILFIVVNLYKNSRIYLLIFVLSIPVSYFFGNDLGKIFVQYLPKNIAYYYFPVSEGVQSVTNFRWDIIIYSSLFVIIPFFYVDKNKKFQDIYNLYLVVTSAVFLCFWPAGPFIHRFAYLAWFLCPFLIFYPLLYKKNLENLMIYKKLILFFYGLILVYLGFKLYRQNFKFVPSQVISFSSIRASGTETSPIFYISE